MIDLSGFGEAVDVALAEASPCVVATASASGEPNLALKGSVMVFDGDHLAFWERANGETLAHLRANPRCTVLYRNRERGLYLRFYGAVSMAESGELRNQIWDRTVEAEKGRDPERKGVGVLVRVDRVIQSGKGVIQQR